MACHVKRIPLCEAEFTEVDTIHAALAQRGFNVEIRPRGNDVTSVCIRTGEARKEVYCKDCKFEVHIGYKDNSTANAEDSVVVQGTKGWKGVRGVENSGIPMIYEIERLLRKQGCLSGRSKAKAGSVAAPAKLHYPATVERASEAEGDEIAHRPKP